MILRAYRLIKRGLTTGDNHPDRVHENEVEVEVERLGPGVAQAVHDVLKVGGAVVQNVAVDLAQADEALKREPQWVPGDHHCGDKKAARSPSDRGDALHAQNKGVLRQIAAVRERVLFPHLSNPRLVGSNVQHVEDVVSLKEDVNGAGKDEPHGCQELDIGKVGLQAL